MNTIIYFIIFNLLVYVHIYIYIETYINKFNYSSNILTKKESTYFLIIYNKGLKS